MHESPTLDVANGEAGQADAVADDLHRLRTGCGWMPLRDAGWIAVTGEDRVRWLNGMVTNSVQALAPGEGAYTFLLSAQGRIQGDATVWAEADRLLLQTDAAQAEPIRALLDRFIIMDDVELQAIVRHGVALAGPAAAAVLKGMDLPVPAAELHAELAKWQGASMSLLRGHSPVVPRFEVWTDDAAAADALLAAFAAEAETAAESFELLRLLEERPRFAADGTGDLGERDLPQETAQMRALHFAKGCYLGQEIVERIRSRGQVHRVFTAFLLRGAVPPAGTELQAEGKPVGVLTSVAGREIDGERLALGFARREMLERGVPLTFEGGSAEARSRSHAS